MSRNISAPYPEQAVGPAFATGYPQPPGHLFILPNNGGPGGGAQQPFPIPGPISVPVPVPALAHLTEDKIRERLVKAIADEGIDAAARLAVQYHTYKNPTDAHYTVAELLQRDGSARANLDEAYTKCHQDSPYARAERLLAPRAGQAYSFEKNVTTFTDAKGKTVTGRKCKGPDCEYRCKDHARHQDGQHVKDPSFGLYCPCRLGCDYHLFNKGRCSEMMNHIKSEQRRGYFLPIAVSA